MEMILSELVYFLRVLIAGFCGLVIGYERKNRAKEAGIRTHFIVSCAACLIMIVSKYGFFDLILRAINEGVEVKLDPSRIASCIVSGVGFLGAGMIFVQKQTIKGLTTAAGIWATAGIGMAIGAGLYVIGILVTFLILAAQLILHMDKRFLKHPHFKSLTINDVEDSDFLDNVSKDLLSENIVIEEVDVSYNAEKGTYDYKMNVEIPQDIKVEDLLKQIGYSAIIENIR